MRNPLFVAIFIGVAFSCSVLRADAPDKTKEIQMADPQMKAVLETLVSLGGKPIETLTPEEARRQPTVTDAVMKLLKERALPTAPAPVAKVEDLTSPSDGSNKYISLVKAPEAELKGLPPATIITDQLDPLMSEGKTYSDHLKAAGVDVAYKNFEGVSHEFFGTGKVVDKGREAETFAAKRLTEAFGK